MSCQGTGIVGEVKRFSDDIQIPKQMLKHGKKWKDKDLRKMGFDF